MFENMFLGMGAGAPVGQQLFESSETFVVPDGVYSICAVLVGPGGGSQNGSGGGALIYSNDIPTIPGESIAVDIQESSCQLTMVGSNKNIRVYGTGNSVNPGLFSVGAGWVSSVTQGYNGGAGGPSNYGGGAAAGYSANGPASNQSTGVAGSGGSGGSGGYRRGGGGVGLYGQGGSGAANGGGGSGGASTTTGAGGKYGGGGWNSPPSPGGVRIIWGDGRYFPDTNTQDM